MRAYFFNNMYLTGMHHGIQAGHALDQMWSFYTDLIMDEIPTPMAKARFEILRTFSRNHKTFIILNGGDHLALQDLYGFLVTDDNPYPICVFEEPGLNSAYTSVAIVLPERMYDETASKLGKALLANTITKDDPATQALLDQYSDWELQFLRRKAMCGLAS